MLLHPIDPLLDGHILVLGSQDLAGRRGKATLSCYFVLSHVLKTPEEALGQAGVVAGSNAK